MTVRVGDDPIFDQSLQCLGWHRHPEWGRDQLDVFSRLLAKNLRPTGWTENTHLNIRRDQIKSRREQWSTQVLGQLVPGHAGTGGDDFDCPIIVAEYKGEQRILDAIIALTDG
jgi:hypothetical protein